VDADVVVIGGGAAGLAAATWLGRYRRQTVLLDTAEPRNRWAGESHGYLGSDPCDPEELFDRSRKQLSRYPAVEQRRARAVDACREGDGFLVVTDDGGQLRCRRVIVATGVVDRFPELEGFRDHYGVSAFHCPSCDAFECRGLAIAAYGWEERVAGFAVSLLEWASDVVVLTDGRRFDGDQRHLDVLADRGIRVVAEPAVAMVGEPGDLRGIRLDNGEEVACQRLFFSVNHDDATDLPDRLGCARTDEGCLKVDRDGLTSVPGVYAAGDITPGMQLVQVAAGKGAAAGLACAMSLVDLGVPS